MAKSASEALKKELATKPDDVWIDEDWKKNNTENINNTLGYETKKHNP